MTNFSAGVLVGRMACLLLSLTLSAAAPVALDDAATVDEDSVLNINAGASTGGTLSGGGAMGVVAEASDYTLVYELPIPNSLNIGTGVPVPYSVDNSSALAGRSFSRIAYFLELESGFATGTEWVYVSMDAFTTDIGQVGLPHSVDNPVLFQQIVTDMNVVASPGANVATGMGLSTGNIEIWPSNFGNGNSIGIPGATGAFDFGDGGANLSDGYGSFQIHNHGALETVFAYNRFGAGGNSDLGIGTSPSGNPDWTFRQNAATYSIKNLQILVKLTPSGLPGGGAFGKVAEAENYSLVYEMPIPDGLNLSGAVLFPYTIDNSADFADTTFSRIAYYLELDSGAGMEWVYVSMDAFAKNVAEIALPHPTENPVVLQQIVNNMNVFSSAGAGVATGTGISTGNIEIWPNNYSTGNAIGIPGANAGTYDFGDIITAAVDGHGSFQVHNHGAGETLIGYNSFGNGGNSDLGIGNSPTGNPDWTFRATAPSYTIKNLQILILPAKSRIAGNGAFGKVPEASDFTVIYELPMPDNVDLSASVPVPYTVDNTGPLAGKIFTRIAYYLELDSVAGAKWVYVSMDPFTADLSQIGLPHPTTNALVTQQIVNNMNVFASGGAGVTTGTGISTGNVEFWPSNYSGSNAIGIPGASSAFDFGDGGAGTGDGYGSFQIHNHGASETLIAYSAFGSANTDNIGIGNQPTGSPDWTFANSAPTYSIKNLQILARVTDSGLAGGGAYAHVPEVSDYTLVYELAIPDSIDLGSSVPVPYTIDNSTELGAITFSRIAYYLELDSGSGTEWVYVSMDAYTETLAEIGVPHPTSNTRIRQQIVNNMNVFASAGAGVTTGAGLSTGNIEMWPNNYGKANLLGLPGASGGAYDFDDTTSGTVDGYGSFQIHNHGPGETIFGYNGFGTANDDCLGIGNRPATDSDWTFANNTASYTIKNLQVFVLSNGLLSNDSDPDGDPLTVNGAATSGQPGAGALSATSAQGASVTVLADGSYNYDPTLAPGLNALATGQTLIDTFTYLADDGNGGTAFATANITVTGVDDLTDDLLTVTKRDSATIIDVLANDSPTPAAIISVTPNTNGGPGGSVINNGTDISYDPNGQFNSLLTGETAIDIFTYTVTGGGVAKVTVTIQGVTGTVFRFR